MDEKLKEAIAAVRVGDKRLAQRQLTEILEKDPQQVQGWYLLSLLVDSPQKQAAYLGKTLALNPNHEKAREQLAALQAADRLAPAPSSAAASSHQPTEMNVLSQSETSELPEWLREEEAASEMTTAVPSSAEVTAVSDENLPDWLKEPVSIEKSMTPDQSIEEGPTLVGKTAKPDSRPDQIAADLKKTLYKPQKIKSKSTQTQKPNTRSLNLLLGLLVTLAIIVILLLAYLLLF